MRAEVRWRKSSWSEGGANNCVEVAYLEFGRLVRDSKQLGAGPVLSFGGSAWGAFLVGIKRGEFEAS